MLGIIGIGRLGEALLKLFIPNTQNIICGVHSDERLRYLRNMYQRNILFTKSNAEVAEKATTIILSVKPGQVKEVCEEIAPYLTNDKPVISMAAALPLASLHKWLPQSSQIIRCMPNIVSDTYIVYHTIHPKGEVLMKKTFCPMSIIKVDNDEQMDQVTIMLGCAPALFCWYYQCLAKSSGLPDNLTNKLLTASMVGTANKLNSGSSPHEIIQAVSSPNGITDSILTSYQQDKLNIRITHATVQALDKINTIKTSLLE